MEVKEIATPCRTMTPKDLYGNEQDAELDAMKYILGTAGVLVGELKFWIS